MRMIVVTKTLPTVTEYVTSTTPAINTDSTFQLQWDPPFIIIVIVIVVLITFPILYLVSHMIRTSTCRCHLNDHHNDTLTPEETYRRWSSPEAHLRLLSRYNSIQISAANAGVTDNQPQLPTVTTTNAPPIGMNKRPSIVGYFDNLSYENEPDLLKEQPRGQNGQAREKASEYTMICLMSENTTEPAISGRLQFDLESDDNRSE
ncbi:uncharacterized protein LOC141900868 [Tubulanus polymorphus]|uniref:uncharacterized protein LOC141900868 n=1 Tax=Tubulanus polymorphus TaxID=672921 RepID=UPI003DA40EFF